MKHPTLAGLIVPVITPTDAEDRVDEQAFRRVIRRLITAGVHGIFVGGSAGEGPLLTFSEWRRMVEIAINEVGGKIPLLGGAIDTSARRIRERIDVLASLGYEHFVVAPSFYIVLKTPDEHMRLFEECAQNSRGMNMIAYNIPSCTGSVVPVDVMVGLAKRGIIRHCKESSGDMKYFTRIASEGKPLGLEAFMGDEPSISEGFKVGAKGIVPVCANVEPVTFIRAYEASLKQDWAELARQQERVAYLRENLVMAGSNWIAGIKQALAFMGYGSGRCVSPLEPLNETQKKKVEAFAKGVRE